MNYQEFIITQKDQALEDTFIFHLVPKNGKNVFDFLPGQYAFLKHSSYLPEEEHPFSIASSPDTKEYLEFCIKVYGDWTQKLSEANIGDTVYISPPQGEFTWDSNIEYPVFLLGGIGISPIMSMLRFIKDHRHPAQITMLYGNRTPETVAYKKELVELQHHLAFSEVDIFSHISDDHPWQGYRGFITADIIRREVELTQKPIFYVIGPPIFIEKMKVILAELTVPKENIKEELLKDLSEANVVV